MRSSNIFLQEIDNLLTNSKIYIIPGIPSPQQRARHSYAKRMTWDAQKHQKLITGIDLQRQHGKTPQFSGSLCFQAIYYFPIPASRRKKITPGDLHIIKPDVDNLTKFVLDVCNKILFNDDCQIAIECAKKMYDDNPRTEFRIVELK